MNAPRRFRLSPSAVLLLLVSGLGLILVGVWLAEPQIAIVEFKPLMSNKPERCLTCHTGIEPISASHPTETFGCVSCHGGERLGITQDTAHRDLVRNPGALDVAEKYCGTCHSAQVAFVPRSIIATYAGAIGLVRRTFGLQPDDKAHYGVAAIEHLQAFTKNPTDPAPVQKFAENCLTCHPRAEAIQAEYFYRSTGCSSCHVLYANDGLYRGGDPTLPKNEAGHPIRHSITKAIPYTQCNHCHNRGNYDLRTMTFVRRDDLPPPPGLTTLGRRLQEYYQPVGEFTRCEWELDCVDCHTAQEVMGTGTIYNTRSEQQYIQCATCHGTLDAPPREATIPITAPDGNDVLGQLLQVRPKAETVIATERGELLKHIRREGEKWYLTGKVAGIRYEVPLVIGSKCQQKPDQQASRYCHECHSYDRKKPQP